MISSLPSACAWVIKTASIFLRPYFGNNSKADARNVLPASITTVLHKSEEEEASKYNLLRVHRARRTHTGLPSFPFILNRALVLRLAFFFPSGVSADVQALHCGSPGEAVRHFICGRLLEVPVPRKMNSRSPPPEDEDGEDASWITIEGKSDCLSDSQCSVQCTHGTGETGATRTSKDGERLLILERENRSQGNCLPCPAWLEG